MVKNFIFIEDGSIDKENLRKLLDESGNTDVKLITYKQGTAKPELVSLDNGIDINKTIEEAKIQTTNTMLDILSKFIEEHVERHVETVSDYYSLSGQVAYKLIYRGKTEDFVNHFAAYLLDKSI